MTASRRIAIARHIAISGHIAITVASGLVCAAAVSACATARPEPRPQAALYEDLRRLVSTESTIGWIIDRHSVDSLLPAAMQSACRVGAADRQGLHDWLVAEIARAGGPAREAFEAQGSMDGLGAIIGLERALMVLDASTEIVGECPFWMMADDGFNGVQGDANRLTWELSSQGSGALTISDGRVDFGGAGAGRGMANIGLSQRLSLMMGLQVGVAAVFVRRDDGKRELAGTFVGVIPMALRLHDSNRFFDFEVGATAVYSPTHKGIVWGGRLAIGGGVTTPRVASFKPLVAVYLGYQVTPPRGPDPMVHVALFAIRIGVNIDP